MALYQGYQIAEGNGLAEIQDAVEKLQELGWVCQGGVCVQSDDKDDWFYQAMVLPAPIEPY